MTVFKALPGALEQYGVVRQTAPEIIDEIGFSHCANIIEHSLYRGNCLRFRIIEQFYCRHSFGSPSAIRLGRIVAHFSTGPAVESFNSLCVFDCKNHAYVKILFT
jgi:hypothetical protein